MITFLETHDDTYETIKYQKSTISLGQLLLSHPFNMKLVKEEGAQFNSTKKRIQVIQSLGLLPNCNIDGTHLEAQKGGGKYVFLSNQQNKGHFIKFRSINTSQELLSNLLQEKTVNLATLSCLFNVNGIRGHDMNGKEFRITSGKPQERNQITEILSTDYLTHYEIESICRQVSYLNSITQGATPYGKLILQFPRTQYYSYGISKLEEGFLNFEQVEKLFCIVDNRIQYLSSIYAKRLGIEVIVKDPMENIEFYIKESIRSREKPSLRQVMHQLKANDLRAMVLTLKAPSNRVDLFGLLGEAVGELNTSFEKGGSLGVIVKNPKEEKSFTLAKELALEIKKVFNHDLHLIGMYPHEQVILNHSNKLDRKKMYQIIQTPSYPNIKEIIAHYKSCFLGI